MIIWDLVRPEPAHGASLCVKKTIFRWSGNWLTTTGVVSSVKYPASLIEPSTQYRARFCPVQLLDSTKTGRHVRKHYRALAWCAYQTGHSFLHTLLTKVAAWKDWFTRANHSTIQSPSFSRLYGWQTHQSPSWEAQLSMLSRSLLVKRTLALTVDFHLLVESGLTAQKTNRTLGYERSFEQQSAELVRWKKE